MIDVLLYERVQRLEQRIAALEAALARAQVLIGNHHAAGVRYPGDACKFCVYREGVGYVAR